MKNHYQLLELSPNAPAAEIRRAFRREIARYHPDKVQHLGLEFQEIAATRAAELTEAYRILMDAESRRKYDDVLVGGVRYEASAALARPGGLRAASASAEPLPSQGVDRRFAHQRATSNDFVRKAVIAKLRDALGRVSASADAVAIAGFDAAYIVKPRRSMLRKSDPHVRLLARLVQQVDGAAIEQVWPLAAKSGAFDGVICLLLLGRGVAPAKELGIAISKQRRKTRIGVPVVVPIDVRNWEAMFPPEAPEVVRQVVLQLQKST